MKIILWRYLGTEALLKSTPAGTTWTIRVSLCPRYVQRPGIHRRMVREMRFYLRVLHGRETESAPSSVPQLADRWPRVRTSRSKAARIFGNEATILL